MAEKEPHGFGAKAKELFHKVADKFSEAAHNIQNIVTGKRGLWDTITDPDGNGKRFEVIDDAKAALNKAGHAIEHGAEKATHTVEHALHTAKERISHAAESIKHIAHHDADHSAKAPPHVAATHSYQIQKA